MLLGVFKLVKLSLTYMYVFNCGWSDRLKRVNGQRQLMYRYICTLQPFGLTREWLYSWVCAIAWHYPRPAVPTSLHALQGLKS